MDIRIQIATVFDLNRCTGCQSCAVACKKLWTDSKGTEHMWWRNVESKPGPGYPAGWEDQSRFPGGWALTSNDLRLRSTSKSRLFFDIFHQPSMPTIEDYGEPWTHEGTDLVSIEELSVQPTSVPRSSISGEPVPRPGRAAGDNRLGLTNEDSSVSQPASSFIHLPRICNHCLQPSCVAACPSGAQYKRGEDGLVLIDQKSCRGWRTCIPACPFKKTDFNWTVSKAEKCTFCFSHLESGKIPACFSACPNQVGYLGLLVYDADRVWDAARTSGENLNDAFRSVILDPGDSVIEDVITRAGLPASAIEAVRRSPIYDLVIRWQVALPLHPEYRTLPMAFYVPPLLKNAPPQGEEAAIQELADLLSCGERRPILKSWSRQRAVREHLRAVRTGLADSNSTADSATETGLGSEEVERLARLLTTTHPQERFNLPSDFWAALRDTTAERRKRRKSTGFGFIERPGRTH